MCPMFGFEGHALWHLATCAALLFIYELIRTTGPKKLK